MQILRESEFRAAVQWEVQRAARYSYFFSVISLDLTTADVAEGWPLPAVEAFGSSIRETDVVGRLKGPRLAAMVHYADRSAAERIAIRIRARLLENPRLRSRPVGLEQAAFRAAVFPTTALDVDSMFTQLGIPEPRGRGDDEDDDEGPGPALGGARV